MTNVSDAGGATRVAGGMALIVAPIVLIVGGLLHPTEKEDAVAQMVVVRDNLNQWYLSHLLLVLGFALLLPALLAVAGPLRTRLGGLYVVGAFLAGMGILFEVGSIMIDGFGLWLLAHASDSGVADDLAGQSDDASALHVLFGVLPLALAAGIVVLAVGVWRARALSVWKIALLLLAAVGSAVQLLADVAPALVVMFLALAVALIPTGVQVLMSRRSSADAVRQSPAQPVSA
jgi:hypothetical protein